MYKETMKTSILKNAMRLLPLNCPIMESFTVNLSYRLYRKETDGRISACMSLYTHSEQCTNKALLSYSQLQSQARSTHWISVHA